MRNQKLALRGEPQSASIALEELTPYGILKPLHLQTDGRLREVEEPTRAGHPAGFSNSTKGTQEREVQVPGHSWFSISDRYRNHDTH